ncbi:unnamed protein product, partial [Symbiodinium microadriaticum]
STAPCWRVKRSYKWPGRRKSASVSATVGGPFTSSPKMARPCASTTSWTSSPAAQRLFPGQILSCLVAPPLTRTTTSTICWSSTHLPWNHGKFGRRMCQNVGRTVSTDVLRAGRVCEGFGVGNISSLGCAAVKYAWTLKQCCVLAPCSIPGKLAKS